MPITEYLKTLFDEVVDYIGDSTTDYLVVKRQLINILPARFRTLFSTRNPSTKQHVLNDFDHEVILYWLERTGVKLEVPPAKLQSPEWVQRERGWALQLLNKEKRKQRLNEQK